MTRHTGRRIDSTSVCLAMPDPPSLTDKGRNKEELSRQIPLLVGSENTKNIRLWVC